MGWGIITLPKAIRFTVGFIKQELMADLKVFFQSLASQNRFRVTGIVKLLLCFTLGL